MAAKLILFYGIFVDPSLDIIDFDGDKMISFDHQTRVFGIQVERKAPNEFIEVNPDIDFDELHEKYESYLNSLVAAVIEVEGDLVTPTQRTRWEKKLRRQEPRLMVGLSE